MLRRNCVYEYFNFLLKNHIMSKKVTRDVSNHKHTCAYDHGPNVLRTHQPCSLTTTVRAMCVCQ